ncbi:NAD(P)-dependent oxidoreductase [Rhizobium yanglingense]
MPAAIVRDGRSTASSRFRVRTGPRWAFVGVGRIGTAVVNRLKPFGFRILGYDPGQPPGT